jgi:hypothetical protein
VSRSEHACSDSPSVSDHVQTSQASFLRSAVFNRHVKMDSKNRETCKCVSISTKTPKDCPRPLETSSLGWTCMFRRSRDHLTVRLHFFFNFELFWSCSCICAACRKKKYYTIITCQFGLKSLALIPSSLPQALEADSQRKTNFPIFVWTCMLRLNLCKRSSRDRKKSKKLHIDVQS